MTGTTVAELQPGDAVAHPFGGVWIHIATVTPHPLYPSLALVIWYSPAERQYSFDALFAHQHLDGDVDRTSQPANLRAALRGPR